MVKNTDKYNLDKSTNVELFNLLKSKEQNNIAKAITKGTGSDSLSLSLSLSQLSVFKTKIKPIYNIKNISLILFSSFFILNHNANAEITDCIAEDPNTGKIVYNPKAKDKCVLLKTVESNVRNKITPEGLSKVEAGVGILGDESGSGGSSGGNSGGSSGGSSNADVGEDIEDGFVEEEINEGDSVGCTIADSDKIKTLIGGLNFDYITQDKDTLLNNDTKYEANQVIANLTCKSGYKGTGYKIVCLGNNEAAFTNDKSGCYEEGRIEFKYTGSVQKWTIPEELRDKTFTFHLFGARGGGFYNDVNFINNASGGYTQVTGTLTASTLYIVVGGAGEMPTCKSGSSCPTTWAGGYNGGGEGSRGTRYSYGGGGGATHIATQSGILSSLSGKKSSILAVAGGSGGGSWNNQGIGGGGTEGGGDGGSSANNGAGATNDCNGNCQAVTCGTMGDSSGSYTFCPEGENAWADGERRGSFGQGGNGVVYDTSAGAGGGGGGYYGGGGAASYYAGGGSAYCNTTTKNNGFNLTTCNSDGAGDATDVNNEVVNGFYQYETGNCRYDDNTNNFTSCSSYGSGHGKVIITW